MVFLIYIKSNHLVSTVKQLAANVYSFSLLLYARTLAGKLNPYLKANLNEKMTKLFYLNDKLNLYTICSEKFQNQFKEQTITTKLL